MATASFPTSPAFNEQFIPAPPAWNKEETTPDEYLDKLSTFMSSQYMGLRNMQNSIASGWLISTLRVLDLDADTITSGTIFTQDLYVGTDGNGGIRLGGTDSQIEITDSTGTTRFLAGDIGSGNWLQISNSSGTVVFQTGTTTFIDGAVITNSTITSSALNITNLSDIAAALGTITGGTITSGANVSAGAIKADTLTVDGSPAISVTGAGALSFTSGGNMEMTPTSGVFNYIIFENSSGTTKGYITYSSSVDAMYMSTVSGTDIWMQCLASGFAGVYGPIVELGLTGTQDIVFTGDMASDLDIDADSTWDIGSTSIRLANIWSDLVNGADICYDNGWRNTEPDKVYTWADPKDGILTMNELWEPVEWLHRDGTRQNSNFQTPDVLRKEPMQTDVAREVLDELDDTFENHPGAIGYSRHGRNVIHRELREWVKDARDQRRVIDDVEIEAKIQEVSTAITLGDYRTIESREKNEQYSSQKRAAKKAKVAERKRKRKEIVYG